MYDKNDVKKLQDNSAMPIEVVGDLGISERKIKLFDLLGTYQTQNFLVFTAYPENDKVNLEVYQLKDLISNINILYAIIPISIQTYKEVIRNSL